MRVFFSIETLFLSFISSKSISGNLNEKFFLSAKEDADSETYKMSEPTKTKKKSFTIHDLPVSERPRERLLNLGSEALSAQEILALVLGRGIAGESVMVTK
uniref:UPF0758 domain-containing protein n=1 Tax=Candidatus Methanophagaceae archaeon ANME-1 ERB6 TaxID=2759912 RepID=A0A7G9YZ01_9EURY|nr:hypothetical protein HNLOENAD_00035 [Methanosarcinales archaeon ANME-1 ERB6]